MKKNQFLQRKRKMKKKPPSTITADSSLFSVGTNVEVLTEQGAWYPAHIISNSTPSPPFSLRSRKQQRRLLVEYETLVSDEDPSKPLREEIDVAQLRPAPPAVVAEEGFEEGDVVEAFQLDGWWRGVVMSVDEGDMYTVGFRSPPDLLCVRRVELRRHWYWSGAAWTKTKKEMMMQLNLRTGGDVEVNLSKGHPWYSWTPATYVGPLGGNSFLVRYASVNNNDVKAVVSHYQIRPPPPQKDEREIELMSMVDAYHDMSWWIGDVIEVRKGEKYIVRFRCSKEEKIFSRSDLRHHMEWNSSTWLTDPKALEESIINVEKFRYENTRYRNSKEKTPSFTKSRKKQSAVCLEELNSGNTNKKLKLSQVYKTGATFSSPTSSKKLTEEDSLPLAAVFGRPLPVNMSQGKDGKASQLLKTNKQNTSLLQSSQQQMDDATGPPVNSQSPGGRNARRTKLPAKRRSRNNNEQILEDDHVVEGITIGIENEVTGETRSESLFLLPTEVNHHKNDGLGSGMRELPMIVAEHLIHPKTGSKYSVRDGLAAASLVKVQLAMSGMPEKIRDHDQSALLLVKEGDSVNTMEQSIRGRVTETGAEGDTNREEFPSLPFVKSIPLWESIESLEVFKRFPQKPHFRPLLKTKAVLREGSAFGKMVAFASLVDQTTKLCVTDPRDTIESNLEATVELEMHGFDVNAIKHRLTKLLELKVRLEELQNQSKVVETQFAESRQNRVKSAETISKIDKEIKDLEENIKALKEERAMVAMVASTCSAENKKSHSEALAISENVKDIQHSFELLAAFPL